MNSWFEALKIFNQDNEKYIIPRKNSVEYFEVKQIQDKIINGNGIIQSKEDIVSKELRDFILKRKNDNVVSIRIGVESVKQIIQDLINIVSLGTLKERLIEQKLKTLTHPFIILRFSDGKQYRLERNERFSLSVKNVFRKATDLSDVIPVNKPLKELIENFEKKVGGFSNRAVYKADTNNSQIFVDLFLKANGLTNSQLQKFYKQKTEEIMKNLPITNAMITSIVDLGQKIDLIQRGSGI